MQNPLHAYSRKAPCAARGRSAARDVRRATTLPLKSPSAETESADSKVTWLRR